MLFTPFVQRNMYAARPSHTALERFLHQQVQAQANACAGVQITQDEHATVLHIDVPGLAREQLEVHIEDQRVQVKSKEGAPRQLHRAWELPDPIDAAASSAKLEHGVLSLNLVRSVPAARTVELAVH